MLAGVAVWSRVDGLWERFRVTLARTGLGLGWEPRREGRGRRTRATYAIWALLGAQGQRRAALQRRLLMPARTAAAEMMDGCWKYSDSGAMFETYVEEGCQGQRREAEEEGDCADGDGSGAGYYTFVWLTGPPWEQQSDGEGVAERA